MSLREQMQAIYDQHGELTPELVVQVARPKDHPLHHRVFDRPQREAAEAWYRERAHGLIVKSRFVVRKADENGPERSIRAWHCVRSDDGIHRYEPVQQIVRDPMLQQLVLRDMERDWKQLRRKYEDFEEFLEMVRADLKVAA